MPRTEFQMSRSWGFALMFVIDVVDLDCKGVEAGLFERGSKVCGREAIAE